LSEIPDSSHPYSRVRQSRIHKYVDTYSHIYPGSTRLEIERNSEVEFPVLGRAADPPVTMF